MTSSTSTPMRPVLRPGETLLSSPRLWLRSMREDDFDGLLAIFSDPEVMAAFHSAPFSKEQMSAWIQRNLDHQAIHGYGLFSVLHKASGDLIGNCGLEVMELNGQHAAELGYDLRSDYWHQGYATEAATNVRDHALAILKVTRLVSLIRTGNLPSRRVAEKVGMVYAGDYHGGDIHYWKYELDLRSWQNSANG